MNQLCYRIQGIEEKVGLKLHPEELQVSLGQADFKLRCENLAGLEQREVPCGQTCNTKDSIGQKAVLYCESKHALAEEVAVDDPPQRGLQYDGGQYKSRGRQSVQ